MSAPIGLLAARRPRVPGSIVLKLRLGEAPPAIATALDVRAGAASSTRRSGLAAVDRILAHAADDHRICRVHCSAKGGGHPGRGHEGYDELEHAIGLSRTFRIDVDRHADTERLVDALRNLYEVENAGLNYLSATPFWRADAGGGASWARLAVMADAASAYEPGDSSVVVAVVDTGLANPATAGGRNVRGGFDAVQLGDADLGDGMRLLGDTRGIDVDPLDEVGHGTACASIIAGSGTGSPPGIAAGCSLIPVRVLGSAEVGRGGRRVGVGSVNDIDVGVKRAVDLGAKVLNLSFGSPLDELDTLDPVPHADVVAYALARGCVLVAASGNSGRCERYAPAALEGVIAVGACDRDLAPASFSTSGDHVALSAPGERVPAAGLVGTSLVTGTSFAAPFVSGAAALLVSRAARRAEPLDGRRVARILSASARPWSRSAAPEGHGAGVLDVLAALRRLDDELDRPADHLPASRRTP